MMTWHAIRVASSQEFKIRDELHRGGVASIVPRRRVAKGNKRDGKTVERMVPLLPGYVFAGFQIFPAWNSLATIRGWIGPVGFDGSPARLTVADVELLRSFDRMVGQERETRRGVRVGDRVPYRVGRLGELHALVKRLRGGKVVLGVELFGSEREVVVPIASIEAAA